MTLNIDRFYALNTMAGMILREPENGEKYGGRIDMGRPDALAAFNTNPNNFDLVISDRGMPNMTGVKLVRELISIRPEIPITICTDFSDENDSGDERCKV